MTDLTKDLNNAVSHEEINSILDEARSEALTATAVREPRAKVEHAEPTMLVQTETIGGKAFTFEADSQAELDAMIANAFRVANAVQQPAPVEETQQVDPAKAAMEQAELELQFRNGQLSAKDYLERSGAIATYLAEQGVPVQELKESLETTRENNFRQSWADATVEFLNSPAGSDWPGGERNKNLIGTTIAALGLVDAEDKVAALAQAYSAMKSNGMIFDGSAASADETHAAEHPASNESYRPVRTQQQTVRQESTTRQEPQRRTSSSLFGASSGTSSNDMRDTSKEPQKINVPSNATPEQILDAWKNDLQSRGIHPDAAFHEAFSGKR